MSLSAKRLLAVLTTFVLTACLHGQSSRDLSGLAEAFEPLIVQQDGRLKPFDTFARSNLLVFNQKSKLVDMSASEWLVELLLYPRESYRRPVFRERNVEVIQALGLEIDKKQDSSDRQYHHYSFLQLSEAFNNILEDIRAFASKPREELSATEVALITLYQKTLSYYALSRSFSGLVYDIEITNDQLASELGLEGRSSLNYVKVLELRNTIAEKIEAISSLSPEERQTPYPMAVLYLTTQLQDKIRDTSAVSLKIVPPEANQDTSEWMSPWDLLSGRPLSDWESERLEQIVSMTLAAKRGDASAVEDQISALRGEVTARVPVELELTYNKGNFFNRSVAFYIISCVSLWLSFAFLPKWLYRISLVSAVIGFLIHVVGILIRCLIMARPPIATLYESVIFVGGIVVLSGILVEVKRRDVLGLFLAGVGGTILHFVGFSYAADGDTMGMLVAVLNSNFWLATHVVTINIGYGAALIAGLFAHAYLIVRLVNRASKERIKEIFNVSYGLTIVAIFFTTLGTILGGIWGDQSWGRFWGWDPKENGALMIVLWLLIVLHGRLAGILKELSFTAGLALTPITVALAWFGVNLLQVGLHSYGFDDGVATNLFYFCGGELVFVAIFATAIYLKEKQQRPASSKSAA